MSNSMDSPKGSDLFENMELLQGASENAAYRQLGHAEEQGDDLEEFEILERPRPRFWQSRRCWWIGIIFIAILLLGIAAVVLHWLAPLFLDKVS